MVHTGSIRLQRHLQQRYTGRLDCFSCGCTLAPPPSHPHPLLSDLVKYQCPVLENDVQLLLVKSTLLVTITTTEALGMSKSAFPYPISCSERGNYFKHTLKKLFWYNGNQPMSIGTTFRVILGLSFGLSFEVSF